MTEIAELNEFKTLPKKLDYLMDCWIETRPYYPRTSLHSKNFSFPRWWPYPVDATPGSLLMASMASMTVTNKPADIFWSRDTVNFPLPLTFDVLTEIMAASERLAEEFDLEETKEYWVIVWICFVLAKELGKDPKEVLGELMPIKEELIDWEDLI